MTQELVIGVSAENCTDRFKQPVHHLRRLTPYFLHSIGGNLRADQIQVQNSFQHDVAIDGLGQGLQIISQLAAIDGKRRKDKHQLAQIDLYELIESLPYPEQTVAAMLETVARMRTTVYSTLSETLSNQEKAIFLAYYFDGRSVDDIASNWPFSITPRFIFDSLSKGKKGLSGKSELSQLWDALPFGQELPWSLELTPLVEYAIRSSNELRLLFGRSLKPKELAIIDAVFLTGMSYAEAVDYFRTLAESPYMTPGDLFPGENVPHQVLKLINSSAPENMKDIITSVYCDNCSFSQVAAERGYNINTLRKLVSQTMTSLKLNHPGFSELLDVFTLSKTTISELKCKVQSITQQSVKNKQLYEFSQRPGVLEMNAQMFEMMKDMLRDAEYQALVSRYREKKSYYTIADELGVDQPNAKRITSDGLRHMHERREDFEIIWNVYRTLDKFVYDNPYK